MLEARERAPDARTLAAAESERFLPTRAVVRRYGISDESLRRWLNNENLAFPRPTYISKRRYWRLRDLAVWERLHAELSAAEDEL